MKTLRIFFFILLFSFLTANPFPVKSAMNFIINTNDINQNGISDVLAFEGKTIVKNVEILEINNNSLSSIWKYSLPESFVGYFSDATILSKSTNEHLLVLIAALKNSSKVFFVFNISNGKINTSPSSILGLPSEFSHLKNPKQIAVIDWDNDLEDEMAISFSGAFRSILICDIIDNQIHVIDNLADDFLSITFSPILIGSGDLNGDKKEDLIVIDNGRKANARIFLNGMKKDGLRILGLKDLGQLSFLSKQSVNFDNSGGDELFFSSKNSGLHYLFVESIGRVNQAVTVKTGLLIDTIKKIYIAEKTSNNQIVTVDPNGNLGRYEIVADNGALNIGVFENKKINFSVMRPNEISSIYFPKNKQLIISAYNDIQSEIYFYNHKSFIEPAIDYSLQREDNRIPQIVLNVNDSSKINIPWVDSLQFYEFSSKNLKNGMSFNAQEKAVFWQPNINQLGFNEIFFDISFKNTGSFDSINEDTLIQVVLNQQIFSNKDSLLIYVNDKPSLQENPSTFNVIGGDNFVYNFLSSDRNIDSKQTFYFLNDNLEGIFVDDSGSVNWKVPNKFIGQKEFNLCVDDSIDKDSINLIFNIHPKIDFSPLDSIYVAHVGIPFSLQFAPDTSYSFNSYKYLLIDAPKNMHIDNSGLFSWEPNPSQVDLNSFVVVISDDITESRQSVSVYVNSKPLISSSPPNILYLSKDENFEFRFDSFDANTDAYLDWSLIKGPNGMAIEPNGNISWIPNGTDFVDYIINLSDGYDSSEFGGAIYINKPPIILSSPIKSINIGDTLFYDVKTKDENKKLYNNPSSDNILSFSIISSPSNCIFNDNILTWIPDDDYVGDNLISFNVSDGLEKTIQSFSLFVNDIPKIFNSDTVFAEVNKQLKHKILTNDLNNDKIDIDLINNTLGVLINKDTLQWLPDTSQLGVHSLNIRLNDGRIDFENNYILDLFVFSKPLFLNTPPKEAYVGIEYIYTPEINFFNKNVSSLELVETSSNNLKLINNNVSWTPSSEDAKKKIHSVVLKAVGYKNNETLMEFFIKVNENPIISN